MPAPKPLDPERRLDSEEKGERRDLVREMLRTEGWQIARDTLKRRLNRIGHRLATDVHLDLERLRSEQAAYQVLARLVEHDSALALLSDEAA